MTRYLLCIDDVTSGSRYAEVFTDFHQTPADDIPQGADEAVTLLEPEGITWLNGEPLKIGFRSVHIERNPVVSNRPREDSAVSFAAESLCYYVEDSWPLANDRIAAYHPINRTGILEVLIGDEHRQVRVTFVSSLALGTEVSVDNTAFVEPDSLTDNKIPAMAM